MSASDAHAHNEIECQPSENNEMTQQALSIDQLSNAFSKLLDSRDTDGEPLASTEITSKEKEQSHHGIVEPRTILEALLFVGNENNDPLSAEQVMDLMRGVERQEVDLMVKELNKEYSEEGCPYHIVSVGAGYQMQLRADFHRLRDRFHGRIRRVRLSQPAIDVLAIVAYNQPTTRHKIDHLRGKPSGGLLSQLIRRELLNVERPPGNEKTPYYRTTPRFLTLFQLESLEELPRSDEFEKKL